MQAYRIGIVVQPGPARRFAPNDESGSTEHRESDAISW